MFRRSSEPLALSEASLLALRPALNTPVLNIDSLPVGPASAAVVVFAEEYGGIGLAIGVRSNLGGQIVVFRNQEPIDASANVSEVLEPALATGERMGFLFDEELVEDGPEGQGRSRAMSLWGHLMGELETACPGATGELVCDSLADSSTTLSALDAAVPELLLDDVATLESREITLEVEEECQPSVSPAAVQPQLSRFRNVPPVPAEDATVARTEADTPTSGTDGPQTEQGSRLGQIPLVRIRREGPNRVGFLARLLSSF